MLCSAGSLPTSSCALCTFIALFNIHLSVGNNQHQTRPHQGMYGIREPAKKAVTSAGINVMIRNISNRNWDTKKKKNHFCQLSTYI